jgi:hypothetical protein
LVLSGLSVVTQAQINSDLVVHEWGTFTSRYTSLSEPYLDLHKTIEEPVPDFVHHINFDTVFNIQYSIKGGYWIDTGRIDLSNVRVKMETPILYFYSPTGVKDLIVDVQFPDGSISEFYPKPSLQEDTNHIKSKLYGAGRLGTNVYLPFNNYNGYAQWKINVLAPDDPTQLTHPNEAVPNMWSAPSVSLHEAAKI